MEAEVEWVLRLRRDMQEKGEHREAVPHGKGARRDPGVEEGT